MPKLWRRSTFSLAGTRPLMPKREQLREVLRLRVESDRAGGKDDPWLGASCPQMRHWP